VTREQVKQAVTAYLREEFGRFLEVRDIRAIRRAAGVKWAVTIVAAGWSEDVAIAVLEVDENGTMTPPLEADDVIGAIRRTGTGQPAQIAAVLDEDDPLKDFADLAGDDDPPPSVLLSKTGGDGEAEIRGRVQFLLGLGDDDSLRKARALMPRLLSDPDKRGATLLRMAEVERRLGEKQSALGFLDGAAREFADRFDMPSLEKSASLALELLGRDGFAASTFAAILEQSRARLRPISTPYDSPSFSSLTAEERAWLDPRIQLRTLAPDEVLVSEGEPSRNVFILKSGLMAVLLEKPMGGSRMVRCCFPGWLFGESSVLVPGDPRCTASLQASRLSEVWVVDASDLMKLMARNESLRDRIAAAKQIHRIDSFFSMHETMGQLDVQVRDEMLGCILRIQTFEEDTVLFYEGDIPELAFLIARGAVDLYPSKDRFDAPAATLEADAFVGVRDVLHKIPTGMTAIARTGTTVAFFEAEGLRALAERSPEHVVAVLERLG
jgi:CRP-like cAMP-binding protein